MKISFKGVLTIMLLPLVALLIFIMIFSSYKEKSTYTDAEALFYDSLYQVNSKLINGDRDFYQASLAVTEYSMRASQHSTAGEEMQGFIDDYNENADQVKTNVEEALAIAKLNEDLYTGTKAENGKTFQELDGEFETAYNEWRDAYDPSTGKGDFKKQDELFSVAREYLSEMQDVAEAWAENEDVAMNKKISDQVIIISIVFTVLVVILLIFCLIFANKMIHGFNSVVSSISVMASGDFVTSVENKNMVKEFEEIAQKTEEMRGRLQESLLSVISLANDVKDNAISTENRIEDSQQMSADISHAVDDLASGATSMAGDVQSTSSLTVHIGDSVESVLGSTTTNEDNSKHVYDNAEEVKGKLEQLKKDGTVTDQMATQVADSVNETANVVEKISQSAETIISIASQTNLLALNASIEAARAGESGKGFAVVADSIKDLANESDAAANEITQMLSEIVSLSNKNKELTTKIKEATNKEADELQDMTASFEEMMRLLEQTEEGNHTILQLVESLNSDKNSVLDSVDSLSSISEENAAATEETSASLDQLATNMEAVVSQAKTLRQVSNDLQKSIEYFKVQ